MTPTGLLKKIEGDQESILELLRQLVETESPSGRKDLVDRVGGLVARRIQGAGLTPRSIPRNEVGDLIWTEWEGPPGGRILVLCHIDTVWAEGSLKRNAFRIENGRIYGPGIFDMKAGVASTLKIQDYLRRGWIKPKRKVRFLYTTDEELTSSNSRGIIEEFAAESDMVLVPEPPLPDGGLKTRRKGVGCYLIRIHGRAAHSGLEPEKGISAVDELARQILNLQGLADGTRGSSVSVTMVRGGSAPNVVADYAEATVDTRFWTSREGERLDGFLRGLRPLGGGIRLEVSGGIDRPMLERTEDSAALFETARKTALELGFQLKEGESGGGSDGNFTSALGIPTLDGLGICGEGAHAWHEHIRASAVAERIALLALLIERL